MDGWALGKTSVIVDPKNQEERQGAATQCTQSYGFEFPTVVDDMLDSTAIQYAAWPERMFVIDPDGRVAFSGGLGPSAFHVRKGGRAVDSKTGLDTSLEAFLEKK